MLQISQALVCRVADLPCGCFPLLTWICHVADFTNTFRSLASVQPEDSSDDLPGPLQEVGTAYSCLLHVPVCPLIPCHPLPIGPLPVTLLPTSFPFSP